MLVSSLKVSKRKVGRKSPDARGFAASNLGRRLTSALDPGCRVVRRFSLAELGLWIEGFPFLFPFCLKDSRMLRFSQKLGFRFRVVD